VIWSRPMAANIPPRWKGRLAAMVADDTLVERRAPKRPRRRAAPAVPSEEAEQLELAWWLDRAELLWCHVPNGELRHPRTAARLKRLGVKAGVPDILIFTPVPRYPAARGVAIELKRANVRRASEAQRGWLADMATLQWCVQICSGAPAAIAWLESLGYGLPS